MLPEDFIEKMKQRMLADKVRLTDELSGIKPQTEMGDNYDDTAEELPLDEVNRDLIARIQSDLEKIDKALAKIANGTYGIGDDGREISQERLEAMPYAETAI
jgi:DnaK suppressor protein